MTHEQPDAPLQRRREWLDAVGPPSAEEIAQRAQQDERFLREITDMLEPDGTYGTAQRITRSADGTRVEAVYHRENRAYWIPAEERVMAGGGRIEIQIAYRIFEENEREMQVRRVHGAEMGAVVRGYVAHAKRILGL